MEPICNLIVVILFVICFICSAFYIRPLLNAIWNDHLIKSKKENGENANARKDIRKNSIKLFLCIFLMLLCVVLSIKVTKNKELSPYSGEQNADLSREEEQEYERIKNGIVFEEEQLNATETVTIWENILYNGIRIERFDLSSENNKDINTLRTDNEEYSLLLYNDVMSMNDLKKLIDFSIEVGIFSETERTVEAISADIRKMKKKQEIGEDLGTLDPEKLYTEEFLARLKKFEDSHDMENLYQAARASNDAFYQLFPLKDDGAKKKILLLATITISLYKMYVNESALNNESCVVDLSLINYRTAEIYIYLYRYYYIDKEYEQLRLSIISKAETFLNKAADNFYFEHTNEDINKRYPYYDAYCADIFYLYYIKTDNPQYAEECRKHSISYLESNDARDNEKASCRDYLIKIEKNATSYEQ